MTEAVILPSAARDLDEIWLYIAVDNVDAATRTVEKLRGVANRLAEMPGMGPDRSELVKNMRSYPEGNYVIFYRKIQGGIEVAHILHGARDLESIFGVRKRRRR